MKRRSFPCVLFVFFLASLSQAVESNNVYVLDDFENYSNFNINDFCAGRGVWHSDITKVHIDAFFEFAGNSNALKLEYNIPDSMESGGWWEHLYYQPDSTFYYSYYWWDRLKSFYPDGNSPYLYMKEFTKFHFSYKGGEKYTSRFFVELTDFAGESVNVLVSDVNDNWQEKFIDLFELTNQNTKFNPTTIIKVAIILNNTMTLRNGTLYFDDFFFVGPQETIDTDDDFLNLVSKKAFNYFLANSHPATGLIRDITAKSISSISATGFGLTAFGIGASRGWINRSDAADITRKTLETLLYDSRQGDSLSGCSGLHGFYYHILNFDGTRNGDSELSSIDTALLMAGVLFSGKYFDGSDAAENHIRNMADSLFKRVDWNWMQEKNDPAHMNQFRMAWMPENNGYFQTPYWEYYTDEALLIEYLAHAVDIPDPVIRYSWKSEYGSYDSTSFYQTYWGSLFTYVYANCWIDLKSIGSVWWDNSVKAVNANRQFCIDNSGTYQTYGENSWGISACFGPAGYNGGYSKSYGAEPLKDGEPNHDGTIPPYGAASSIIFFPSGSENYALKALKNYYENYPELWGIYGFKDAYNLGKLPDTSDDWYCDEYVGIDMGAMLLSIENYRSGLVWKTFMKNIEIPVSVNDQQSTLTSFTVYQNSPNPFNSYTLINYFLPKTDDVLISIYNVSGQTIFTEERKFVPAGKNRFIWNSKDLSSGIYFCTIKSHLSEKTIKMSLIK